MSVALTQGADVSPVGTGQRPSREIMKPMESGMKNQWVQEHLTDAEANPSFSFVYGGKASVKFKVVIDDRPGSVIVEYSVNSER